MMSLLMAPAAGQGPITLSAHPGDVVRVEGTALVFGKSWNGLIGVDLAVKPGAYPVTIKAGSVGSKSVTTVLTVLPKQFPVRRLQVPPDFVTPPAGALEQIAADNKKTAAIFARVGPRRWTGPFKLPVDGRPTSNFGTRSYFNGQPRSPHSGIDFLSASGTPIRAANDGIVVLAESLYFTGNTVIVDYGDGLYSLFAHLSEFRVHDGEVVKPDTIVGLVGATGRVTGPHLHWAVKLQGARIDPASLVAATE